MCSSEGVGNESSVAVPIALSSSHSTLSSHRTSLFLTLSLSPFPASPACLLPFVASERVFAWCALSPRLSRSSSFSRLHEDDRCRLASRDAARDVEKGVGGWGSLVTRGYRLAHYQLLQAYFQNLRPPGIKWLPRRGLYERCARHTAVHAARRRRNQKLQYLCQETNSSARRSLYLSAVSPRRQPSWWRRRKCYLEILLEQSSRWRSLSLTPTSSRPTFWNSPF